MKRISTIIFFLFIISANIIVADDFKGLWKNIEKDKKEGLPASAIELLDKVIDKAEDRRSYGNMIRAVKERLEYRYVISPDSFSSDVEKMERSVSAMNPESVKHALYNSLLGNIYTRKAYRTYDEAERKVLLAKADSFYVNSVSRPDVTAGIQTCDLYPLFPKQKGTSLLVSLAFRAGMFDKARSYFIQNGDRTNAMIMSLECLKKNRQGNSRYLQSLDSLISVYEDLDVCCEAAAERYSYLSRNTKASNEDKIRYVRHALKRWGRYEGSAELKNAEILLTLPSFETHIGKTQIAPGDSACIVLRNVRNIKDITTKIYRTRLSSADIAAAEAREWRNDAFYKNAIGGIKKKDIIKIKSHFDAPDYAFSEKHLYTPALSRGIYIIESSGKDIKPAYSILYVSSLFVIAEPLPHNRIRLAAVDITDGKPAKDASITVVGRNRNYESSDTILKCNADGEAVLETSGWADAAYAHTEDDTFMLPTHLGRAYGFNDSRTDRRCTEILTDRAIYRPGQTVKVATISYTSIKGTDLKADSGAVVTLKLLDSKLNTIAQKEIVSDAYGKATAEFELPENILSGIFHISDGSKGNVSIRVEEYKRPTFDVKLASADSAYSIGDTVKISGKAEALTGLAVKRAAVRYEIKRCWYPWMRAYGRSSRDVIASGSTTTADDGSFYIDVPLNVEESRGSGVFYFVTEAYVTDAAGETQSGTLSIPVSEKKMFFNCIIPEKIEKSAPGFISFALKNIAGKDIDADVKFCIDGNKYFYVKSNSKEELRQFLSGISFGLHKITAEAEGLKLEKDFVLFSLDDRKPVTDTDEWFFVTSDTFGSSDESIKMQVGSSRDSVHVFFSIISSDKLLGSGTALLNNEIKTYELKYKEEYGDGILISYAWVKGGKLFARNVRLEKSLPEKKLRIEWASFRDRLVPGQKEEWKLKVMNSDGSKADASLAATLYDMSLDNIAANRWTRIYGLSRLIPQTRWNGTSSNAEQNNYARKYYRFVNEKKTFNVFPAIELYDNHVLYYDNASTSPRIALKSRSDAAEHKESGIAAEQQNPTSQEDNLDILRESAPQLRANMNETAFFYPSLTTDRDGCISISFTLPESITAWKFIALANDREMANDIIESIATATKDFMVQPAMPRFVRRGDKAVISARITNLSEKDICGDAIMQLCSAETGRIIIEKKCRFDLKESESGAVSFSFDADTDESLLVCKIFAESNGFSDGEQHYLAVLSDKEQVTNTRIITLNEKGYIRPDTKSLFGKDAENSRFAFEYAGSPQWLAIQALPSIAENDDDDAISTASRIYAAEMARNIAKASPDTRLAIEEWDSRNEENSMRSRLQGNPELKDIALEETPWIMNARDDTERMHGLSELFNDESNDRRIRETADKLISLQLPDGSWAWWKGMNGSRHVTLSVVEMLIRLEAITGSTSCLNNAAAKAMDYLAAEIEKDLKDDAGRKQTALNTLQLRYLYLMALQEGKTDKTANSLLDILNKHSLSGAGIYEKCMAAIILCRNGNKEKAAALVKSIKEHSVCTKEMGRYFDSAAAGYTWCDYKIPTQTMAIEAIRYVTPDDVQTICEMEQWLLQEKRTTSWNTPVNAVNAIYAITHGGKDIAPSGSKDAIILNGKAVTSDIKCNGYVSASSEGSTADLTVNKNSSGMSWLSMYGSYTADAGNIGNIATGLHINREIITEEGDISTGSIIKVKLKITADRDYDFVQIIDKRAACMEPTNQISGFNGRYYYSIKDNAAYYYFDKMPKGTHIITTEYYADRKGVYQTGSCKVQCAYSPEFRGTAESITITVK